MKALIIGCGSIGARRARILCSLGVELALIDQDYHRADQLGFQLGVKDTGADVMVKGEESQADVCLICTPPSSHLALAQQCAEAWLNVFIEKPLAAAFDRAATRQLVDTMRERGVWGVMGQSYRFLPSLREFRLKFIDKPVIAAEIWQGQHLADWRPGADYKQSYAAMPGEGGVVLDSLAHSLDIAQWLFGGIEAITALVGSTGELGIPTDDVATGLVRMKTGAQVTVHNDYWQRPRDFHVSVVCAHPPLTPPVASAATGGETDENTFTWRFDPAEAEQMYLAEMQHLVRCVERRYQGQPDLFQGILNLEWMDAAQRAAQTGTWQRINGEWARLAGRK